MPISDRSTRRDVDFHQQRGGRARAACPLRLARLALANEERAGAHSSLCTRPTPHRDRPGAQVRTGAVRSETACLLAAMLGSCALVGSSLRKAE